MDGNGRGKNAASFIQSSRSISETDSDDLFFDAQESNSPKSWSQEEENPIPKSTISVSVPPTETAKAFFSYLHNGDPKADDSNLNGPNFRSSSNLKAYLNKNMSLESEKGAGNSPNVQNTRQNIQKSQDAVKNSHQNVPKSQDNVQHTQENILKIIPANVFKSQQNVSTTKNTVQKSVTNVHHAPSATKNVQNSEQEDEKKKVQNFEKSVKGLNQDSKSEQKHQQKNAGANNHGETEGVEGKQIIKKGEIPQAGLVHQIAIQTHLRQDCHQNYDERKPITSGDSSSNSNATSSTMAANYKSSPLLNTKIPDIVFTENVDIKNGENSNCPNIVQPRNKNSETSSNQSHSSCPADVDSMSSQQVTKADKNLVNNANHFHVPVFTLERSRGQMRTSSTSSSLATMTTSCIIDDLDLDRDSTKVSIEDSASGKTIVLCPIDCYASYYKCWRAKVGKFFGDHMIAFILFGLVLLLIFNFGLYSYIFYLAYLAGHQF